MANRFSFFHSPPDSWFSLTNPIAHGLPSRNIGRAYDIISVPTFKAVDIQPALDAHPKPGYKRYSLAMIFTDTQGIFKNPERSIWVSIAPSFSLTHQELGKAYDLKLYPKYLSIRSAIGDHLPKGTSVVGKISRVFQPNLILVKTSAFHNVALYTKSAWSPNTIGKFVKAELFQEKHPLLIEESTDTNSPRLLSIAKTHDRRKDMRLGYFEHEKSSFVVNLEPSNPIGPNLVGKTFKLKCLDKYYLHTIEPKNKKSSKSHTDTYVLESLLGDSKAIFNKNNHRIHVDLGTVKLSPSQMGTEFHLSVSPIYHAPWVVHHPS